MMFFFPPRVFSWSSVAGFLVLFFPPPPLSAGLELHVVNTFANAQLSVELKASPLPEWLFHCDARNYVRSILTADLHHREMVPTEERECLAKEAFAVFQLCVDRMNAVRSLAHKASVEPECSRAPPAAMIDEEAEVVSLHKDSKKMQTQEAGDSSSTTRASPCQMKSFFGNVAETGYQFARRQSALPARALFLTRSRGRGRGSGGSSTSFARASSRSASVVAPVGKSTKGAANGARNNNQHLYSAGGYNRQDYSTSSRSGYAFGGSASRPTTGINDTLVCYDSTYDFHKDFFLQAASVDPGASDNFLEHSLFRLFVEPDIATHLPYMPTLWRDTLQEVSQKLMLLHDIKWDVYHFFTRTKLDKHTNEEVHLPFRRTDRELLVQNLFRLPPDWGIHPRIRRWHVVCALCRKVVTENPDLEVLRIAEIGVFAGEETSLHMLENCTNSEGMIEPFWGGKVDDVGAGHMDGSGLAPSAALLEELASGRGRGFGFGVGDEHEIGEATSHNYEDAYAYTEHDETKLVETLLAGPDRDVMLQPPRSNADAGGDAEDLKGSFGDRHRRVVMAANKNKLNGSKGAAGAAAGTGKGGTKGKTTASEVGNENENDPPPDDEGGTEQQQNQWLVDFFASQEADFTRDNSLRARLRENQRQMNGADDSRRTLRKNKRPKPVKIQYNMIDPWELPAAGFQIMVDWYKEHEAWKINDGSDGNDVYANLLRRIKEVERKKTKNPKAFPIREMQEGEVVPKDRPGIFTHRRTSEKAAASVEAVDFLFVDGDHSYQGCHDDMRFFYPKTKILAAGHDFRYWDFHGIVLAVLNMRRPGTPAHSDFGSRVEGPVYLDSENIHWSYMKKGGGVGG